MTTMQNAWTYTAWIRSWASAWKGTRLQPVFVCSCFSVIWAAEQNIRTSFLSLMGFILDKWNKPSLVAAYHYIVLTNSLTFLGNQYIPFLLNMCLFSSLYFHYPHQSIPLPGSHKSKEVSMNTKCNKTTLISTANGVHGSIPLSTSYPQPISQ